MVNEPTFDDGGGGGAGTTGGGGTSEDPRKREDDDGEVDDGQQPTDGDGPAVTPGGGGGPAPGPTPSNEGSGELGSPSGGGGPQQPDTPKQPDRQPPDTVTDFDPTAPVDPAVSRAIEDLTGRSELIDERDVQIVTRGDRRFVRVNPATARTLGGVGFGRGAAAIEPGGLAGETGGGEDLQVRGPPEDVGLLPGADREPRDDPRFNDRVAAADATAAAPVDRFVETGGGEDFGVQGGDIVSQVEAAVARQIGRPVDLTREDIQIGQDGSVSLTESGARKAATPATTGFVESLETGEAFRGAFEAVGADPSDFSADVPLEGPLFRGGQQARGRVGEAVGVPALDEVELILRERARQLREADVRGAVAGTPFELIDDVLAEAVPLGVEFAGSVPAAAKDALDIGAGAVGAGLDVDADAAVDAALAGDLAGVDAAIDADIGAAGGVLAGGGQAVVDTGVLAAEGALRDPDQLLRSAAVSLPLSFAAFRGASAIGPRANLAARGLIQPGEELAGIGGFAAARRVAGEARAEQLFPGTGRFNREPLVFSEEAALRRARQVGSRARDVLRRTEVTGQPGLLAGGLRVDVEPRTEGESETVRPGGLMGDPETFPVRELREQARQRAEQEQRVEETAEELARLREAQQPSVEAEDAREGVAEELGDRRLETATGVGLLEEARLRSIAEQVSELRQREETPTDLDQEVDQELFKPVDIATEIETELETELEGEGEQEGEGEFEGELEAFLEADQEIEQEFEEEDKTLDDLFAPAFDFREKVFASGIADVEDLEDGLLDDFASAEDDVVDGAGFEAVERELLRDFEDPPGDIVGDFQDAEKDLLDDL